MAFCAYLSYQLAPVRRERNSSKAIIIALLIAISTFFSTTIQSRIEGRFIPSSAMEPTLQIGDRILVDKLSYQSSVPQRTDIVIFRATEKLIEI